MKIEDFNKLPYISRKELVELRDYCTNFCDSNSEIISLIDNDINLYVFKDKTSEFFFEIISILFDPTSKKNLYSIHFFPRSLNSMDRQGIQVEFAALMTYLTNWLGYVKKMHEVTFEYFNPFKEFYENEFKDYFENNDEDATINPFELSKQEIIYRFLIYAETKIQNETTLTESEKESLLNSSNKLKESIPQRTKKQFSKSLNDFARKVKTTSNKLFHDIFDVAKKEVIKKILYEGVEQIPTLVENINGLLHN